jgi:hypothetical protein
MKYSKPNLEYEWREALRYREFEKMGKEGWMKAAKDNFEISNYNSIKDVLGNVNLDFDDLDENKKKRFEESFKKGEVEIPLAVKFSDNDYDLLGGNTRLAGLIKKGINPKIWVVDISKKSKDKEEKEVETKEQTMAASSGAFVAPLTTTTKKETKEQEFTEATSASSSGAYDVPLFGTSPKGRKDPLKIDGVKSIGQSRAVKDKKFPKWGGPDSVFVKVKEKCKKYPYCNEGPGAIELVHEDEEIRKAIEETSKNYGIPYKDVENIVLKEINKIFI